MKILYKKFIPESIRDELYLLRHNFNNILISRLLTKKTGLPLNIFNREKREIPEKLKEFKNKYPNKRCFIMGNGPSLNKMDLNLLKNEYTWGSNRCYLLYDKIKWRHNFFVSVDTRVLPDIALEVNKLVKELPKTSFFFPVDFCFSGVIKKKQNTFFFNQFVFFERKPETMFSFNPSNWVSMVNTVTITALQLAVYMGFNPIYLIGCDTSYKIPSSVKFENNNSELLTSTKDDDSNHFDPRYFGKGRKWHDPNVGRMFKHYEVIKMLCDKQNIKIYNATVGGDLEIFPRIDYNSLF